MEIRRVSTGKWGQEDVFCQMFLPPFSCQTTFVVLLILAISHSAFSARVLYTEEQSKSHWAFQPIASPEPPALNDSWIRNPIDAFILKKLRDANLTPSPRAPRPLLRKRLSYTLSGLPPNAHSLAPYSEFRTQVDRLLASDQYGVYFGRHWLDIARYADNNGNRLAKSGRSPYYPYAWTYRDWVINAFNSDQPYDEFVRHQIAGDSFATANDKRPLAALGFLRVGRSFGQNVDDRIDDRIDALTKGLLGLTVSCARCHDHKFDPVLTRDYYALHGIFASSEDIDAELTDPAQIPGHTAYRAAQAKRMTELRARARDQMETLVSRYVHRTDELLLAAQAFLDSGQNRKSSPAAARQVGIKADLFEAWIKSLEKWRHESNRVFTPWFELKQFTDTEYTRLISGAFEVHPGVLQRLKATRPKNRQELASLYRDLAIEIETAAGRHFPIVELILDTDNIQRNWRAREYNPYAEHPAPLPDPEMEELRQVLLGFQGPWGGPQLPPRMLFRSGIGDYKTPIKMTAMAFLKQDGEDPRAPIKAMTVRDHVKPANSPVYLRGDKNSPGEAAPRAFLTRLAKPDAQPYANGSGRLELARDITRRDNPLTARVIVNRVWQWHFGEGLVPTSSDFGLNGLPPTHPELLDWLTAWFMDKGWSIKKLNRLILNSNTWQQDSRPRPDGMAKDSDNKLLWRMSPRQLRFEELRDALLLASGELDLSTGGRPVPEDRFEESTRRTAYLYINRYQLPYEFQIFDFATPDFSTAKRESAIVPQQALYFLNHPWVKERANKAAQNAQAKSSTTEKILTHLWQAAYQRPPTNEELRLARQFLKSKSGLPELTHALFNANEFVLVR